MDDISHEIPVPGAKSVHETTLGEAETVIRENLLEDMRDCACYKYELSPRTAVTLDGAGAYVKKLDCVFRQGTLYRLDPETGEYAPETTVTAICPEKTKPTAWSGFVQGGLLAAVAAQMATTGQTVSQDALKGIPVLAFLDGPSVKNPGTMPKPVISENGTGPIQAADHVFGLIEAEIRPFEPAGIDWSVLAEKKIKNPTYGQNQVPGAIVNSCSECCMSEINGKPNLLGILHRKTVKSCSRCPVGTSGDYVQARDGHGRKLYVRNPDGTVRPMTQSELVVRETDETT